MHAKGSAVRNDSDKSRQDPFLAAKRTSIGQSRAENSKRSKGRFDLLAKLRQSINFIRILLDLFKQAGHLKLAQVSRQLFRADPRDAGEQRIIALCSGQHELAEDMQLPPSANRVDGEP